MTSSPSPFSSTGKLQVMPNSATLLLTPSVNNNVTISNIGNSAQHSSQTNIQNGTISQQQSMSGLINTPSIVRFSHSPSTVHQTHQQNVVSNQNQFMSQTWTNNSNQQQFTIQKTTRPSTVLQYATVNNEATTSTTVQPQSSIIQTRIIAQPVVRQQIAPTTTAVTATITAATPASTPASTQYTETQLNDFVSKCRTFLTTLLGLAEKQAPEKLPMVRSCIQELLDGTISPESFTQKLHTLYKSQPHVSLVPFFKLALPHMRQIVRKTFGCPITIDLLEKIPLPATNTANYAANSNQTTNQNRSISNLQVQQQQSATPMIQQPLHTTVQTQQKTNLFNNPQQTVIGAIGSLLSQQQQQQQQARTQLGITTIRPIVPAMPTTANTSLLSGQSQIQPVTQRLIQQPDSLLQRPTLSGNSSTSSTGFQQPQIITVNPHPIKTEPIHTQSQPLTIASIQPKQIIKTEDNSLSENNNFGSSDNRHIIQDDRFISAYILRRRLTDIIEKDKRLSDVSIKDDAVFSLISNAAQQRLKYILEQVKLVAQHRTDISMKNDPSYQQTTDVKAQIRFLEDLDKIEKQKKDKLEQDKIMRAAKSRSKANDPEAVKLKQKAKEMQQAQVEEKRQKEANETALAAIGKPKKRKLEESTNHSHGLPIHSNGNEQISPIQASTSTNNINPTNTNKSKAAKRTCRANLRDLLSIMERDKYIKRTALFIKALNK